MLAVLESNLIHIPQIDGWLLQKLIIYTSEKPGTIFSQF
jgi:hypothetical protein